MNTKERIEQYLRIIWESQLPLEEKQFLHNLLAGKSCVDYKDDLNSDYSLFFAYNAAQNGYKGYREEQITEFKTILQVYKMERMQKIPAMAQLFKLLNENGIIPVLLKGAAMMCYYAPDIPRMMGDIDIWIKPEQYDMAMDLIMNNGYEFVNDTGYHIAVSSKKLDVDIHRYIYKNGGDINSNIYDNLINISFLGAEVAVLSSDDMLIHQLANRGLDIVTLNHEDRHFKWIIDCWYILKHSSSSIKFLLNKSLNLNNLFYVQLTLFKMAELFPELFTEKCSYLDEEKYSKWLNHASKYIDFYNSHKNIGLKKASYVYLAFYLRWQEAVMNKIITDSKKPILLIMMQNEKIDSTEKIIYRLKRLFKNSKLQTKKNE